MTMTKATTRLVAPAVPYIAILVGLYAIGSGWAAMLLYHIGILLVWTRTKREKDLRSLVSGWNGRVAAAFSVVCLGSGVALYVLWPLITGDGDGSELAEKLESFGLTGVVWVAFMIYYTLVNPWLEELFWRGMLGSDSKGLVPSDALFAGYHILVLVRFVPWYWALIVAVTLVGTAWLWRQIGRRYSGLLVPVATHLLADGAVIIAAHLLTFSG